MLATRMSTPSEKGSGEASGWGLQDGAVRGEERLERQGDALLKAGGGTVREQDRIGKDDQVVGMCRPTVTQKQVKPHLEDQEPWDRIRGLKVFCRLSLLKAEGVLTWNSAPLRSTGESHMLCLLWSRRRNCVTNRSSEILPGKQQPLLTCGLALPHCPILMKAGLGCRRYSEGRPNRHESFSPAGRLWVWAQFCTDPG